MFNLKKIKEKIEDLKLKYNLLILNIDSNSNKINKINEKLDLLSEKLGCNFELEDYIYVDDSNPFLPLKYRKKVVKQRYKLVKINKNKL